MSITWEPLVLTLCIIDTQKLINGLKYYLKINSEPLISKCCF